MDWTTEQILGLAPDQFTLRAARGIADPQKWVALHQDAEIIWGIFPNGRNQTVETAVSLPNLAYTCNCKTRKFPCRHAVGLFLLWQIQATSFTSQPLSTRLTNWAKRTQINFQRHSQTNGRSSFNQQKHDQLQMGLYALELWLLDMMRHGLASLPERPKSYWETMAHRLVDAQSPTLAQTVRDLAHIPVSQPNWPETYLKQVGRLYLLVQGFRNFDHLPTPVQADLQTAVGWLPALSLEPTILTDHWLVLGRQQESDSSHTRHHTWLWGQETEKLVQLIDLTPSNKLEGRWLPTNSIWQGSCAILPGTSPLLARPHTELQATNGIVQPMGFGTIRAAIQAHNEMLSLNPWLPQFPILLHNVQPCHSEAGWQIRDQTGAILPLPEKYSYGWHLMALSERRTSLTLFGLWNGRIFQPLSVNQDNQWQDIHIWRGVR